MSQIKIDVLIPAIDKDAATLPLVIDSLRTYVRHPIGRILIISPPNSERIKQICARKGCTFVNENTVLPITKKHIQYSSAKWSRAGWLYQQLLKLSGDTLTKQDYFLTIDADTVLIRPHRFLSADGRPIFYCRNWSQPDYFIAYRKLLGRRKQAPSSFVTHYMLFKRTKLAQMKREIEAKHNTSWYTAIIRSINKKKLFAFSEFETYGNYQYSSSAHSSVLRKARNISLPFSASMLTASKRSRLASRGYRSISLHKRKSYFK